MISNAMRRMRASRLCSLIPRVSEPQRALLTPQSLQSHSYYPQSRSISSTSDANATDSTQTPSPESIILNNALRHVQEFGWTTQALAAGARDSNYSSVAHGLFPNGAIDLIHHFMDLSNEQMRQRLISEREKRQQMSVMERLEHAICIRLSCIVPYREHWAQAMAMGALPQNAKVTLDKLARAMDEIWYFAGDTVTDMRWYQKRLLILGVYASAELFLLTDHSVHHEETWKFVRRRLEETVQLSEMPQNLKDVASMSFIGVQAIASAAASLAGPLSTEMWRASPLAVLPNPISAFGNQIPSSVISSLTSALGSASPLPFGKSAQRSDSADLQDLDEELSKFGV